VIARNRDETAAYLDEITTPTLCLVGSEDKVDPDTGNHVLITEPAGPYQRRRGYRRLRPLFLAEAGRKPIGLSTAGSRATDACR